MKHTLDNDGSNVTEGEGGGERGRNNDNDDNNDDNDDNDDDDSDDNDDDDGEKSAKRMRHNEEPSTTNGEEDIGKRGIWEDLCAGGDGKGLDEFCVDVTDRDLVRTAAQELEVSNRIMISDDVLYLV